MILWSMERNNWIRLGLESVMADDVESSMEER